MNIVLLSHTFLPKVGGREIVVLELAKALARKGHDVRVVGPSGARSVAHVDYGIPVHRAMRLTTRRSIDCRVEQCLLESQLLGHVGLDLLLYGADVVHAHSLYPAGYVASLLKRMRAKWRLVLTPHGIDINVAPDRQYGMRLNPQLARKIDKALARADFVTAISDGVYREIIRSGVPVEKVRKVPNGIDFARLGGDVQSDVRAHFGIPDHAKIILTVGNYTPLKGHEDLVRAMSLIAKRIPDAWLVIVGSHTEHLRELAAQHGVAERLTIAGPLPPIPVRNADGQLQDRLADLYRSSAVYVSASNREGAEGLSLSLLDAMGSGLPVVGTDIVGNRDVIRHGENGFLVALGSFENLASAIADILQCTDQAQAFGRTARQDASKYGWDRIAESYLEVYQFG